MSNWRNMLIASRQTHILTPLTLTAQESGSTVAITREGNPNTSKLYYRLSADAVWTKYTIDKTITLGSVGDYVQFCSESPRLNTANNSFIYFVMTGKVAASGNVQSMLNWISIAPVRAFYHMFWKCTALTQPPILPATALQSMCYGGMFRGCTSLVSTPKLPATSLDSYCYENMFEDCTSLVNASELPATVLDGHCYQYMFKNCTSLTKAPELPSSTLVAGCYYGMFYGCTNLNEIKVKFTKWDKNAAVTSYWVQGVKEVGTFYKPTALAESRDSNSAIPNGWDVVNID